MALVDPNIALSYRGLQLQDPLDQYSKASAAQLNALQMDKFMRDRDALKQIQAAITAKGGPPDLESAANEMIRSGIPEYMTQGIAIRQKVQETKAWEDYQKRFLAPKTQVSEESAAPTTPSARVTPSPFQANMLDNRQNLPLNRLMPSVEAPAAPAPQASKAPVVSSQQQRLADLEEEIAMLSGIDTPKAKARQQVLLRQLEAALKPEANRPIPLSPGQVLYSPTGQRIAAAPEKPSAPTEIQRLMNERDALPVGDPRIEIYNRAIAKASTHSPGTTVNLPPQEKAEQSDRGKLLVKQYEGISEAARIGARSLPALQSNIAILDKDFETGFGTEAKAAGAKVLAALGVKDAEKYATDAQTFLGNASAAVLQRQLEQKGPQTEADAQRITQTGAQLGNTKEANKFLINVAKAQINRDIDQRNFYDKWWKTNKTYDGAEDAWYAGEGGKSLFERPELKSSVQAPSIVNQIPTGRAPTPAVARPPATKPAPASGGWSVVR